jgi:hypothetical protein
MFERLKRLATEVGTWSWPLKFLVGALVSVFAGTGILGFFLENAAYAYALAYGFRPPVEGIPYLRALIGFANVALLVIAAVISAFVMVAVKRLLIDQVDKDLAGPIRKFRALPTLKAIGFIAIGAAALMLVQMAVAWVNSPPPGTMCVWPLLVCAPKPGFSLPYLSYAFIAGFSILSMIWRPSLVWWGTAGLILGYFAWVGINVLPPDGYARLLRNTGFGGGIHVTVELTNRREPEAREQMAGNLLLRSTHTLILFDPARNEVIEYPMERVLRISHSAGGLHMLPTTLPKRAPWVDSPQP